MNPIITQSSSHVDRINAYVNWLFKDKAPFVVLKRFNNTNEGVTKMYIALPVRERKFVSSIVKTEKSNKLVYPAIHDVNIFNDLSFDFKASDIIASTTLYSGNIFEYYNITSLLARFKFITRTPNVYNQKEKIDIFRDYTRTKKQQEDSLTLIQSFTDPAQSVNSIYRLLHTKYVTIIDVTFKNSNYIDTKDYGNKTL